jgi:1-acyl-sn-glycerol-3-phosphate acyltransferase
LGLRKPWTRVSIKVGRATTGSYMRYTLFDTPLITPLLRLISRACLRISNFRPGGTVPDTSKFIIIGVPHTSNWDFVYFLFLAFHFKVKPAWMGKDSLFRGPFGAFFTWTGGIPIDRSKSNRTVEQAVELFNKSKNFVLVIAPEGTRKRAKAWKSGFYHIANGAKVPIAMGFLDYKDRIGGFGPLFSTTGNIQLDLEAFREFYRGVTARYPDQCGEIALATRE